MHQTITDAIHFLQGMRDKYAHLTHEANVYDMAIIELMLISEEAI
jgi:hypothetical protein